VQADLLLHIVDTASTNRDEQIAEVNKVLDEIGAQDVAQILVMNQIDRTGLQAGLERDEYGRICKVLISAKTGAGLQHLEQALKEHQQRLYDYRTTEAAYI
jgi:GTP-binding protein HflX